MEASAAAGDPPSGHTCTASARRTAHYESSLACRRGRREGPLTGGRPARGAAARSGLDPYEPQITSSASRHGPAPHGRAQFSALLKCLRELTGWLRGHGVTAAAMERSGIYWKAPFETLEDAGFEAELFRARHGKKCDPQCKASYRAWQFGLLGGVPGRASFRLPLLPRISATSAPSGTAYRA